MQTNNKIIELFKLSNSDWRNLFMILFDFIDIDKCIFINSQSKMSMLILRSKRACPF